MCSLSKYLSNKPKTRLLTALKLVLFYITTLQNYILWKCVRLFLIFDPDNIATPLISSMGDLASLMLLAAAATMMDWFATSGGLSYIAPVVLLSCSLVALPFLWYVAAQDKSCAEALKTGTFKNF